MLAPPDLPSPTPLRRILAGIRFKLRELGILQACALALTLAAISLGRLVAPGGKPREIREARLLARVLGWLRGPFAKLAQFASLRVDLLAEPARRELARLRDDLPPLPFAQVARLLEAELGAPLAERFAAIDPQPLGAASIAQVHRARLPDQTEVAVKVQYPWLRSSLPADLRVLRRTLRRLGPGGGAPADTLFAEFSRGLQEELDFEREARVAAEIAANLAGEERVVVPRVVGSHSTRRVLTVELHPTLPLQRRLLESRGICAGEVLEIVARAYARQIFLDGLFHADPHPGNLFVIDEPGAPSRPRVLFVDFGLSKRLPDPLRRELRRGIYALLQADAEALLAGMERLGLVAPDAREPVQAAVAAMFQRIRGEERELLGLGPARILALKDEAKRLLFETPGLRLPPELLLYAKTWSYLFAMGQELAPEVDLMKLCVPYLLRFLAEREAAPAAAGAGPGGG